MVYNNKDGVVKYNKRRKFQSVYCYYQYRRICYFDAKVTLAHMWLPVRLTPRAKSLSPTPEPDDYAKAVIRQKYASLRGVNDNGSSPARDN